MEFTYISAPLPFKNLQYIHFINGSILLGDFVGLNFQITCTWLAVLNHLVLSYQLDYQRQCSRHLNVYRCRLYGKVFWSSPGSFLYSDQKLASGIDEAKKVVKLSICTRSGWPP